jgi:aspartate carbamoyltransferase catalytic subunit
MIPKFEGWPHVICSQQFTRYWLENNLFPEARMMRQIVDERGCEILKGKRVVTFFYEPSTRTRASFEFAADYLGARVVFSTENAREFSSAKKGETLMHTMRVLNVYRPDAIVLRYDREIGSEIAASVSCVPIINAGDRQPKNGPQSPTSGQHPTQAFLDIFTMQERFGHLDGLSVAMVGDLRNGRTVRSLSYILAKFKGIKLYFVSPENAQMRDDVKKYLAKYSQNIQFTEEKDLRKVAPLVDVVYQTRTQTECGASFERDNGSNGYFLVNMDIVRSMQGHAIVMHPLPCVDEIDKEVDGHPRAVYLTEQIAAGLLVRMALLKMILAPTK